MAKKEIKSNVPEFSVGELAQSLKRTLEETYGRVRVRGEIGRVTIPGSGHLYTNLKDENATIDAVCWKGSVKKLSVKPEEGLEVIVTGRVSSYPASSKYQIIIESMELAGEGALLKMLEERRKKLAAEGLFDEERKKELPFLPDVIGVITSPTGAVIRDILHRLEDRFPRHVLLWPVLVQGEDAAAQISAAIDGFQNIHNHGQPKPDLLIVGRGGGSLEDLMPFNEESVVRAVANSDIPIISAVGHETDTTLCDFAAALRAPTPTGAAEMAVPVRAELMALILDDQKRMVSSITRLLSENRHRIEAQAGRLGDPARLLETYMQKLDHLGDKVGSVFKETLSTKHRHLITLASTLPHPKSILHNARLVVERWVEQLFNVGTKIPHQPETRLAHAGKMLEAYSFENVLERGFAVVQDSKGKLITEAAQTETGQAIHIRFKKNKSVDAVVGKTGAQKKLKKKPSKSKKTDENQTSLF